MQRAFSLVELSIVLVILGLLTGGILAGKSLIRAAELRNVTTEFQRYITAVNSFRDKYFAAPGDIADAHKFWTSAGGNGANSTCQNATTSTSTTCSGDGNGYVTFFSSGSVAEGYRFWQHLALAGLIEGSYTGQPGVTLNVNIPASKLAGATWFVSGGPAVAGDTFGYATEAGNMLQYLNAASGNPLKPEEAWNIDSKMDDGKPGSGKVLALKGDGTSIICTTGDNLAPPADANATYVLTRTAKDCGLIFQAAF